MSGPKNGENTPPKWIKVRLSNAITPDANGATMDPQGLLSGPIVEVSPGRLRYPLLGGVAKLGPIDGATVVFPLRDRYGALATEAPRGFHARLTMHTKPAGSSGVVIAVTLADVAALTNAVWGAIDWDNADPRARSGKNTGFSTGAPTALTGDFGLNYGMGIRPEASAGDKCGADTAWAYLMDSTSPSKLRVDRIGRTVSQPFTGLPVIAVTMFGSGILTAVSPEFTLEYDYDQLAIGTRL